MKIIDFMVSNFQLILLQLWALIGLYDYQSSSSQRDKTINIVTQKHWDDPTQLDNESIR